MKIKQKIIYLALMMSVATGILGMALPSTALAAPTCDKDNKTTCCGGVDTAIISCKETGGTKTDAQKSPIWGVLVMVLNIMTAGVGILGVGGIVYGSILYSTAGDKSEQTKKAIGVITNVVVGIAAYGLMYVFLNFLIPGGIFT
jgi:hypothetical protein